MKIQDIVQDIVAGPLGEHVERVLPTVGALEARPTVRVMLVNGYGLSLMQRPPQVHYGEAELLVIRSVNDPQDGTRHDYSTAVTRDVIPNADKWQIMAAINVLKVLVNDPTDITIRRHDQDG